MKSNFYRLIKTRRSILIIAFMFFLPFIELLQHYMVKISFGSEYHPAFAYFLSSSSQGHATQAILFWFLPIYFFLISNDNIIQDSQTGYRQIVILKTGKKKYIRDTMFFSFIIGCIVMAGVLLVNFIFSHLLFNGTFKNGLDEIELSDNWLFTYSMKNHYFGIIFFSITTVCLSGLASLLGSSMSLFFKQRQTAYISTFFIWFTLGLRQNSLMFLMQPFAEYDLDVLIPIGVIFLLVTLIPSFLIYFHEVKEDEL